MGRRQVVALHAACRMPVAVQPPSPQRRRRRQQQQQQQQQQHSLDINSIQQMQPAAKRRRTGLRDSVLVEPAVPLEPNGIEGCAHVQAVARKQQPMPKPSSDANDRCGKASTQSTAVPRSSSKDGWNTPPTQPVAEAQLPSPAVSTPSMTEPLLQPLARADSQAAIESSTQLAQAVQPPQEAHQQRLQQHEHQQHEPLQQQAAPLHAAEPVQQQHQGVQVVPSVQQASFSSDDCLLRSAADQLASCGGADVQQMGAAKAGTVPSHASARGRPAALSAPGTSPAACDDSMAVRLAEAWAHFQAHQSEPHYLQFHEVDTLAVSPTVFVGRELRLLWPNDDAWFLGTAASYDAASGKHKVVYADGEVSDELLCAERLRLRMQPGEAVAPPSAAEASAMAIALQAAAAKKRGPEATVLRERAAFAAERHAALLQQVADADTATAARQQTAADAASALAAAAPPAQQGDPAAAAPNAAEPPSTSQRTAAAGRKSSNGGAVAAVLSADLRPGDLIWAQVKGWPYWPALVMTHLDADDMHVPVVKGDPVALCFFGTQEYMRLRAKSVMRFDAGLAMGLHAKCRKSMAKFRTALFEVLTWLKDSELPDGPMEPPHFDDPWLDDEEEELHTVSRPRKKAGQLMPAAGGDVVLPLQLGQHLRVLALGRIEYIHPAFHNEKYFWPVGYVAERVAATPASGGKPVVHRCEVLAASDGSGPLFRVQPKGSPAVEAATASGAWNALYSTATAAPPGRSTAAMPAAAHNSGSTAKAGSSASALAVHARPGGGMSGTRAFGLGNPRVLAELAALPGANCCERFCNWPDGEVRPPPPPLSEAEQRQRAAALARMQRLPEGVDAVAVPTSGTACHVCGEEDEADDNVLLQCDGCRVLVHQTCYGVGAPPNGRLWLCDSCQLGLRKAPPCCLCPVAGGALKGTSCGRWAHLACALWAPDAVGLDPVTGLIDGIEQVSKARRRLLCSLCRQPHGACIQCAGSAACFAAFHPLCARAAGYAVATVDAEDDAVAAGDGSDALGSGDSDRENSNANVAAMVEGQGVSGSRKRKRRQRVQRVEGTTAGDGVRRLCFCPRHRQCAAAFQPSPPQPAGPTGASRQRHLGSQQQTAGLDQSSAGRGAAVAPSPPMHPESGGCARAAPYDAAARRGLRAPDAAAIAIAKRTYLRQVPYLTTSRRLGAPLPPPSSSHSPAGSGSPGMLPPSTRCNTPSKQSPSSRNSAPGLSPSTTRVASLAQRYAQQALTLAKRITAGKSAIHGFGAFTKLPHAAGDMVVEYVGEIVRRSVVSLREAAEYDARCGSGTYVFGMSASSGLCTDATRAGNLAHLLNHSCQPNCHSRLITVWDAAAESVQEHVMLFARADIPAGAELTYDYRFAGEAALPCNCGAPTCRRFVNEPRSLAGGDGRLRLPLSALRPLKKSDLWHDDGSL